MEYSARGPEYTLISMLEYSQDTTYSIPEKQILTNFANKII